MFGFVGVWLVGYGGWVRGRGGEGMKVSLGGREVCACVFLFMSVVLGTSGIEREKREGKRYKSPIPSRQASIKTFPMLKSQWSAKKEVDDRG